LPDRFICRDKHGAAIKSGLLYVEKPFHKWEVMRSDARKVFGGTLPIGEWRLS